ncbi:amino acid ABC transporter permease [Enterococcus bulliens]|uniref:amino acid ABC transporter permease n=1 Tax=uncultured Enterococcus sp. TaxID=167972 RepID=UPI0025E0650D|nr:amino acid ABC transporter permease [uncultured Enterococcus sp.]
MTQFFQPQLIVQYFPKILSALPVTLGIVLMATGIGLVLGALIAFSRIEKVPILAQISTVFVSFIRGTPILVQLYIVYYGIPALLQATGLDISNWNKLIFIYITYGLNTAAFQSETIRAAILSIPEHQKEAAIACGLSRNQFYRKILFPQMLKIALPSFGTTTIALLQDTSLAFTIGLIDVVGKAKAIGAVTYHTLEGYIGAAIIFIVLSIVLEQVFQVLEKTVQYERTVQLAKPRILFFKKNSLSTGYKGENI